MIASPRGSRLHRAGAWLFVVVSLGHLFWHWGFYAGGASAGRPAAEAALLAEMSGLRMPYPGPARSLLDFQIGFSVTMGLVVLGLGVLNLVLERSLRRSGMGVPASVAAANCGIAAAMLGAALAWLALMPTPFLLAAAVCFAVAAWRTRRARAPRGDPDGPT